MRNLSVFHAGTLQQTGLVLTEGDKQQPGGNELNTDPPVASPLTASAPINTFPVYDSSNRGNK